MNTPTETIRDIYARLIDSHPGINAGALRQVLIDYGLTLRKNEPHCTLHQLVSQNRVIAELPAGSKVRTYRINPDWTPTPRSAPDASDIKPAARPAHRPGLTALTPVTEDPRELLRRAIAQHVAEHPTVWFTCNGLAEMLDEDAADVAKALRALVESGSVIYRRDSLINANVYAHPTCPLPGPPAAASLIVGDGAEVQSAERAVIQPTTLESVKKRLDDLEEYEKAGRDRAVLIDVLEGLQDKARTAGTLVNAVAWLQRDAEDLAGRAVDEGAPREVIKALIAASGAAARAALAIAITTPAPAGTTKEHAS